MREGERGERGERHVFNRRLCIGSGFSVLLATGKNRGLMTCMSKGVFMVTQYSVI